MSVTCRSAALILAVAACGDPRTAERSRQARSSADSLDFPAPNRPVSSIVAPRWTDESERDRLGEAARVLDVSGIASGMTVADIGAGDGYYVVRISPRVGVAGRVIGEDIEPQYLELLRKRVAAEKLQNVTVTLGTPENPGLASHSVDVALLIHMYHEITRPFELLWHLSVAMKSGGKVAVVDQDGPTDHHGTPLPLLRCEFKAVGFEQVSTEQLAGGAYVTVFSAPTEPLAPATIRQRLSRQPCKE